MAQLKPILNKNSNFTNWTSPTVPAVFTLTGTTANVRQLNRQDNRRDPKRQWFPKQLKASDYIFDGANSFGWFGTSGQSISVATEEVPVTPGMLLSMVVAFKWNPSLEKLTVRVRFRDSAAADVAYVEQDNVRNPYAPSPEATISNLPGRPAVFRFSATTPETVQLRGTEASEGIFPSEYWKRYGVSGVHVPSRAATVSVEASASASPSAATTFVALGEIRVEAEDSHIHAGG